jgi:putative aldouronate transport system permease protein
MSNPSLEIELDRTQSIRKPRVSLFQICMHVFFILAVASILFPLLLVLSVSFTDEKSLYNTGYTFIPSKLSLDAYNFLWQDGANIIHAYGITIIVTLVGTLIGLLLTALYAYPISRQDFPWKNAFSFFIFFTILFNGGLVPWYLVYTNLFDVKDTILALIVPGLLLSGFYVLIMRTFFQNTLPPSIIESATIDGAGEFRVWWQIVMPLSLPVLATIGLFSTLSYWNDWFSSLIFISNPNLYSLQYLMQKTLLDSQFLAEHSGSANLSSLMTNMPTETVRMAMAIIGVGPIILAYPFFQRYFIEGLTIGAVKG